VTVTSSQISKAKQQGLRNVDTAARVCNETKTPFFILCALLEKESGGRNVYGHDQGGALSGFERPVNQGNWEVFRWLVFDKGKTSNGVGPMQLTFKGFFTDMEKEDLKPWDVHDNMTYGARVFMGHYRAAKDAGHGTRESIKRAGVQYNGATAYGDSLLKIAIKWADLVGHVDHH